MVSKKRVEISSLRFELTAKNKDLPSENGEVSRSCQATDASKGFFVLRFAAGVVGM
jgi:hypothetical protein